MSSEGQSPASSSTRKFTPSRYSILVVDNEASILQMISDVLEVEGYKMVTASEGLEGSRLLSEKSPDLIISDYSMPGMNGLELLEMAREKVPEAARILCTGYADVEMALSAVNKGAVNRILTKPFSPDELVQSVQSCMEQISLRNENRELLLLSQIQNEKLAGWNQALEQEVASRTSHIDRLIEASIYSLAELAESRARDIGGHLRRMQEYSKIVAESYMKKKNQSDYFISTFIDDLYLSTLLHDVGKVGIPDGILFKPDRLSPEEFSVMKLHAVIGQRTIQKAQTRLGDGSFLTMGISIAGYHHERWDGTGYPEGLAGEDIPLSARIVSIADVYDALNSPRVYKEAWSHQKTVEFMSNGSETQFDPELIKIFLEVEKQFEKIRNEMIDESIGL